MPRTIYCNERELRDSQWPGFASRFLRQRISTARKDFIICLTGLRFGKGGAIKHAYFPAFMVCTGLLELLSGLHAGDLKARGGTLSVVDDFRKQFLERTARVPGVYGDGYLVGLMIEGFRHKVAHLAHPYIVFDKETLVGGKRPLLDGPGARLAWEFRKGEAGDRALAVVEMPGRHVRSHETPWPVPYDSCFRVSLMALFGDIRRACLEPEIGYLAYLQATDAAMRKFRGCMKQMFPSGPRT